jgi:uncharacterized protein YndB with AHSA1/START domain
MAPHSIERTIHLDGYIDGDLDLPADEAWRLIGTAEGWREWLVDEAEVDVREGGGGEVVDDGVRRAVRIETVQQGARITFVWSADDGDVARVTLQLELTDGGRRVLRITEQPLAACAECPLRLAARDVRWDLRECLLCLSARATSRV